MSIAMCKRMDKRIGVSGGERRWGMSVWIVMRSDIVLWRLFSVVTDDKRRKDGGLHLMKTTVDTNNIGRKYLEHDNIRTGQGILQESLTSAPDMHTYKPPTKRLAQASFRSSVISS